MGWSANPWKVFGSVVTLFGTYLFGYIESLLYGTLLVVLTDNSDQLGLSLTRFLL